MHGSYESCSRWLIKGDSIPIAAPVAFAAGISSQSPRWRIVHPRPSKYYLGRGCTVVLSTVVHSARAKGERTGVGGGWGGQRTMYSDVTYLATCMTSSMMSLMTSKPVRWGTAGVRPPTKRDKSRTRIVANGVRPLASINAQYSAFGSFFRLYQNGKKSAESFIERSSPGALPLGSVCSR